MLTPQYMTRGKVIGLYNNVASVCHFSQDENIMQSMQLFDNVI